MREKSIKRPWDDKEVAALLSMWELGRPIPLIAAALHRKPAVIRAKVSHLRTTRPDLASRLPYRADSPGGKLGVKDIPKIRRDSRCLRLIAADYGVSAVTIFKVKRGETWRDA